MTLLPTEYLETTLKINNNQTQTIFDGIVDQTVQVKYPRDLPAGKPVLFEMTLLPAQNGHLNSASPATLEGRLDIPGVDMFPGPVSDVAYDPAQTISFRWLVTAGQGVLLPGRLWLTMIVPDPAGGEERTVWLAYPLELGMRRVIGLTFTEARWIGGGLVGTGLVVLLLQLQFRSSLHKKRTKIIRSV